MVQHNETLRAAGSLEAGGGFSFEGVVLRSDPQICRDNEFDSLNEERPTCSTRTPIAGR